MKDKRFKLLLVLALLFILLTMAAVFLFGGILLKKAYPKYSYKEIFNIVVDTALFEIDKKLNIDDETISDTELDDFIERRLSREDENPVELPKRTLTNESIAYDGKKREIACWGDSLTFGYGYDDVASITVDGITTDISCWDYPRTLEYFTGIKTHNLGVPGETSEEISIRAGGIEIFTDRDIEVGYFEAVDVKTVDKYGRIQYIADYGGFGYEKTEFNSVVYINNMPFILLGSYFNDELGKYENVDLKIKRLAIDGYTVDDKKIKISAGSKITPKAARDYKDAILILEIGSNGGWENNYQELIYQYDLIIQNSGCKYYIIVGDTDNPGTSLADTLQKRRNEDGTRIGLGDTAWEAALREAYGDHFINMRTYLIENGLDNVGFNATRKDLLEFRRGNISKQLRYDWTHLNSYGYYSKGLGIYKKGIELGYWS